MTKIIGERLRRLRVENRYSQAQIAEMCGYVQARAYPRGHEGLQGDAGEVQGCTQLI